MSNEYLIPKVGRFEKLSEGTYKKILENFQESYTNFGLLVPSFVKYQDIQIPKRKTQGSAGFDICLTQDIKLFPGSSVIVPTFIRCYIEDGWLLQLYPRSGLGFKYNMKLANTVGIVDGDYYGSKTDGNDNEGHIMIKILNGGDKTIELSMNDRFCQAIFTPYGITYDDDVYAKEIRSGGIGSTNLK